MGTAIFFVCVRGWGCYKSKGCNGVACYFKNFCRMKVNNGKTGEAGLTVDAGAG